MIELQNVSFSYANSRENSALRRIDLTVKKGELVILAAVVLTEKVVALWF